MNLKFRPLPMLASTLALMTALSLSAPVAFAADEKPAAAAAPGRININLKDLPNDMVICTVGADPIKVGDYRRTLTFQQANIQKAIASDQIMQVQLLTQAKQRGITLTAAEKADLLKQAQQETSKQGKMFQEYLKERSITEAQYNQQILEVGIMYKMARIAMEEGLLDDLINRQLLINAAKRQGFEKRAMEGYFNLKKSPNWERLKKATGLPADILKDEVVNSDLAQLQMNKIRGPIKVTNAELVSVYNANKTKFKHGERIRLASILIPAPQEDNAQAGIESVRTQYKKAFPKLTDKELDAKTTEYMQTAQQKALIALAQAKAPGVDFAKLANQYAAETHSKPNGGDLGWQEKPQLVPEFANAVWGLKKGDVVSKLIRTSLGFQIIKVTDKQKTGLMSMQEVKPVLEQQINQAKTQNALAAWLNQQRQTTKIEYSKRFLQLANGGTTK